MESPASFAASMAFERPESEAKRSSFRVSQSGSTGLWVTKTPQKTGGAHVLVDFSFTHEDF